MLFALKNRVWTALLALVVLVALACWLRGALGLHWNLEFTPNLVTEGLVAAAVLAASDGGIHGLLLWTFGDGYFARYRMLANYFAPQRLPAILAGGLLAGGEELLFRGVLLESLWEYAGLSAGAAVLLAALAFAVAHGLPYRWFAAFFPWTVWEGTLLGGVYVLSGSLSLVVVLHVLHDIAGFTLFARQRHAEKSGPPVGEPWG